MTKETHLHPDDVSMYVFRTAVLLARAPFWSSWSPLSTAKAVSSSSTSQQHALSPSRTKSTASRFSIFRRKAAESSNSSEPRSVVADKGHFLETSGTGSNAFLDHPFIRTAADLFNENGNEIEIRKQLELMRTTCTEKDYMNDLKQCISAIHYGQPWPGRRADFPSSYSNFSSNTEVPASFPLDPQEADRLGDEEYAKWSVKELAELRSMMADMCERDPVLFKVSNEPEERYASSVSRSVFTFIPPDPREDYRHLLSRMLTYDLEAMKALGPDEDVSVGILSNDHLGLLDELARCWRVNDGWRRAVRFELIRELYEDGQCPLESLDNAFQLILEPAYTTPPGSTRTQTMTKGWMIYERDLLSSSLNQSFRSVVRWLYDAFQDPSDADVEQVHQHATFVLQLHSTGMLFEPAAPNLQGSSQGQIPLDRTAVDLDKHIEEWKDAVKIGAINMYAEQTAALFGKVLPPGSNVVRPLLELCDWVTSRAKILNKQWGWQARVLTINFVALVLQKQVPLFLDDLESMKQSVLDWSNALSFDGPKSTHFEQIFVLLRTVRGLFQLYATFCPEQIVQGAEDAHLLAQEELPEGEQDESWPGDQLTGRLQKDAALLAKVGRLGTFSLSRWFEPHVWRWLSDTELQLEPFAAHSPSIDILFSEIQAPVDFVLGLDWSDKLANARFTGKLAEIVSRAVEQYFTKSEGRFRREMGSASDRVAQTIKTGLEPALFHIRPMSCVRLNNIEKARKQLDKLYSKIDADEQARIVNRHGPSPEFSETPGQEVTQQGGTLSTSSQRFLFTVKIVLGEELSSVSFSAGSAGSSSSVSGLNSFVTLSQETGRTLAITRKIRNSAEKRWNETFDFSVQGNLVLNLTLWNNDLEAGKAVLRLNPSSGLRSSSEESWLTLDTGARLLVQVSMEEEKDDVVFAFGRANRSLKRAESTMVGILVDQISSYARLYLSPEGLESLATSLQSSSVTSVGIGAESSRPATDRQIRAKLSPLLNYLKGCLATLTLGLSDTVATLVLQQVWEEILKIIEDILVPPLGITLSTFEPLDDLEVYIVFKWLQFLLTCFNGKDQDTDEKARVPLHILQGPKYREIMSYSLCNDMGTNQLLTEIQRLVQQRDRAQGVHSLDPAVYGPRLTPSVYDQRNLAAIEQWERRKAKEVEAKGNLELLLRLLRMRPDAEHYLQMTYDAAGVAYVRPPNEKLYQGSSSTTAGPFEETAVYDAGQHLRAPTQIPISARSQPVDHTRMFDTVREQEKAYAGEDNVKVHRAVYEGPSTTFETMSERPRPWRAETQESCGTSHEAEAAIMNGRLGCLLLSFPASAAFLLLVATFSRSASSWQGTHDPPRLGLVALLLMASLRSTFLVRLPLAHIVRVMMGSNSPAAKHLGGLIHHGVQVLLVADISGAAVLALCYVDGTSWYHAARVNEGCNELGTPHTQPSLDQKFTPPARPREDTPETKPPRTATKGQRPSSLRIFALFLVCQAAVIFLHLVAYFEGHLRQLGPVQGRTAPFWQPFAFLVLLLAVSIDISLSSYRQLTLSPVLSAIFGSRPFVAPLQDLLEHLRLASLQVDLVAVLGLAFLFCTGGSWYEAAANHIGLETRTLVAAGATSSSPHVKANAPLSDSVPLAPTVADDGPTDGIERGSGFDEEAEVQGYLIEVDASEHSHETPADTTPATKSINVDEGIPRDHDRKGKSRQVDSAADQFATLMSKLKADNLATTEALNAALLRDSKASARAPGSRPSEQGQSSRTQDDQEPSL
ncbi:hypothetical protein OC845_005781 [Tilletia horrida]|nr:hypothetical protein OC845_005781 [Tilletia horrida]